MNVTATLARGRPGALTSASFTAGLLVVVALVLLESHDPTGVGRRAEARLADMWATYHRGDFEGARAQARACEHDWEAAALAAQEALSRSPAAATPIGHVPDVELRRVLGRTALNAAATCFHLEGRAAEALRDPTAARTAYQAAMRFPDGRYLDRREEVLWSPAAASGALLHRLR